MDNLNSTGLPSPLKIRQILAMTEQQRSFIAKSRDTIKQILNGVDSRQLLIVGPCSIHDSGAAIEYAESLKKLSDAVSDSFYIIMRVYTEKSRTSLGWRGMLYDPDLDGSHDIAKGIETTRSLLLKLTTLEIPTAGELLDPFSVPYYSELLSWGCIGARTAESQQHRLIASGLPLPVGIKNNTSGCVKAAINGVLVAAEPHTFINIQDDGTVGISHTQGNPDAHVVLRGGSGSPNYDAISIRSTLDQLEKAGQPRRVIIDCSHDNSRRDHEAQNAVFESVLEQIVEGNNSIRGLILESHINGGCQSLNASPLRYAVSITDPCLDWPATIKLIEKGCLKIKQSKTFAEIFKESV